MEAYRGVFGSSDSDATDPQAVPRRRRRCGKALPKERRLELEINVLRARLELERARRQAAEAAAPAPKDLSCPLTQAPVASIQAPVVVCNTIVDAAAVAAHVDHNNPSGNPNNPSTLRVPHFHAPNEYATLGFAVSVVTEAQQKMYGARKTPLDASDRSAVDLVLRLLRRRRAAAQLRDSDTEYESDSSAF